MQDPHRYVFQLGPQVIGSNFFFADFDCDYATALYVCKNIRDTLQSHRYKECYTGATCAIFSTVVSDDFNRVRVASLLKVPQTCSCL